MQIIWAIIVFIICLIVIYFAADFVLDGIEELGKFMRIPAILLAYVLIGIDLEETAASWTAASTGLSHLAVGNVIGNTIISIGFCFAFPALFFEISFKKIHKWILPILLIFGIWINLYLIFPQFRILFGVLSILSYIGFMIANFLAKNSNIVDDSEEENEKIDTEVEKDKAHNKKLWKAIFLFCLGMVLLYFSSHLLIISTETILLSINIDEAFFGLVIIAAGTNVEEYMILFKSIKRKRPELGLGGLLGKIIWNCGINFGISLLLIKPSSNPAPILLYNGLLLFGLMVPTMIIIILKKKKLAWKSAIPLLVYFGFYILLSSIL